MPTDSQKQEIAIAVVRTLYKRFAVFPEDASGNRNAPFHEAFLNAFSERLGESIPNIPYFMSLASWLQGLNTTLGQTFFENVAHTLSNGSKRGFTELDENHPGITSNQTTRINQLISNLKNGVVTPNLEQETEILLSSKVEGEALSDKKKFTVDVYYEDEDIVVAIELKTVKPNAGEMRGEKQKILEGKTALMNLFPNKEVKYFLGFPFDPLIDTKQFSPTDSNKDTFLNSIIDGRKYFAPEEILLAGELWDFLSEEEETMEWILGIINNIATPEFLQKYQYLQTKENLHNNMGMYIAQLADWYLYSEIRLAESDSKIRGALASKADHRQYNQLVFKEHSDGETISYNSERAVYLSQFI